MHKNSGINLLTVFLFLLNTCFAGNQVILEGLIEVHEEDEKYNPIEVNLVVDKVVKNKPVSEYYRIINEGKGVMLLKMLDKKVRITGTIGPRKRKDRSLKVVDFSVIDPGSKNIEESSKQEVPDENTEKSESDG